MMANDYAEPVCSFCGSGNVELVGKSTRWICKECARDANTTFVRSRPTERMIYLFEPKKIA